MLRYNNIRLLSIGLSAGLILLRGYFNLPVVVCFIPVCIGIVITATGSFNIQWNYHINAFHFKTDCKQKQIAITFDDGPHPEYTPQILQLLQQYKAKATFFCIGEHIKTHPDLVKRIVDEGHTIGNHTYTHSPFFDFNFKREVINEITKTNALVLEITGKNMKLFRPPYGVTNPAISKAIATTQHHVIGWSIRSLDTVKQDQKKIMKRIVKRIKPGAVILLHDSKKITVSVLEQLLLFLQENDYQPVTVDTLFNIEAYA